MSSPLPSGDNPPKLAILVSFSGQGGVERMIANLSHALIAQGVSLDILLIKNRGPHSKGLPSGARTIELGSRHTATSILPLARYLRREKPDALLAVKHRGIIAALRARALAGTDTPIAGRLGTTVSVPLASSSWLKRGLWFRAMRRFYPKLCSVVAVSDGVAEDIATITGLTPPQLRVIRNPVINEALKHAAEESIDHPALNYPDRRVVMGAGRLTRQKDFPTLLRAFARIAETEDLQLVILGDGEDREALIHQAHSLGISERLTLPGFQSNPWAWMKNARAFVLSSRWEGSPNSLTEALALGVPVVSTDCPSGPRELLQGGTIAPLVPMGDDQAMADALLQVLTAPPPPSQLTAAVSEYRADISARHYLEALGITAHD